MRKSWILAGTAALALSACAGDESVGEEGAYAEAPAAYSIEAAPDAEVADAEARDESSSMPNGAGEIAVSMPQIAYRYELGFRLPAAAMKPLQEQHADMCEAKGPNVCRIISMSQTEGDGEYAYGNLQIAIASAQARAFSKSLETSSNGADAELTSSSITGEDLSKQIVDTEARLTARTVLRDRLMEVLRTRRGSVQELVEAERGVAQVNEEIDQARSWLNEMRGRVAFSRMDISYQSGSPSSSNAGSFTGPIVNAWNALGAILGNMIGFLMMAMAALLPVAVILLIARAVWKWARQKRAENETQGLVAAENPSASDEG